MHRHRTVAEKRERLIKRKGIRERRSQRQELYNELRKLQTEKATVDSTDEYIRLSEQIIELKQQLGVGRSSFNRVTDREMRVPQPRMRI